MSFTSMALPSFTILHHGHTYFSLLVFLLLIQYLTSFWQFFSNTHHIPRLFIFTSSVRCLIHHSDFFYPIHIFSFFTFLAFLLMFLASFSIYILLFFFFTILQFFFFLRFLDFFFLTLVAPFAITILFLHFFFLLFLSHYLLLFTDFAPYLH